MRDICRELRCNEKATPHDLRRTHGTMITRLRFGRDAMNRISARIGITHSVYWLTGRPEAMWIGM